MTSNSHDLKDRLEELRGALSLNAFAKMCEIGESSMRQYLKGSIPSADKVMKIAEVGGVNVEWLITGNGSKHKEIAENPNELGLTVYNVEVTAGCGSVINEENIHSKITLPDEIYNSFNLSKKDSAGVFIKGDSMEPKLFDKDIALINTSIDEFINDGIYVFNYDAHCFVKQLQKQGRFIEVNSLNKELYKSWIIKDTENLKIIGEVKGKISKI